MAIELGWFYRPVKGLSLWMHSAVGRTRMSSAADILYRYLSPSTWLLFLEAFEVMHMSSRNSYNCRMSLTLPSLLLSASFW